MRDDWHRRVRAADSVITGIEAVGLREFTRSANRVSKEYGKEMGQIHKAVAEPIAASARGRIRSRSGRLAATVRAQGTQRVARVAAGKKTVPYAGVNQYGWPARDYPANPFLTDAIHDGATQAVATYEQMTEAFIDKVWKTIR